MAAVLCALLSTAAAFTATPFAAGGGVRMACARRHRPPLAKADDEFGALAAEVRQYLSTLDEAALNDPEAPSPLAYVELGRAGRADLVETIMRFGGYLKVSEQLGVRVRDVEPAPEAVNPFATQPAEEAATVGVSLSPTAKEDKMRADLERLAASGRLAPDSSQVSSRQRAPMRRI